mgnify:CR=1 FL=1
MKIIKINDTFYDVEIIGDGYKIETILHLMLINVI